MIRIKIIQIERYRSILNLKLEFNQNNNFITVCGENNTGKTNTLRAINLFFNPDKYNPQTDVPFHKLEGSRGDATPPKITIDFLLPDNDIYRIQRLFNLTELKSTTGKKLKNQTRLKEEDMNVNEIELFLKKIEFFFIESINISFPTVINNIMEDIYDIEYDKSRFIGLKSELKNSFEKYTQGLLDILTALSNEINPLFHEYRENWGVSFDIDTDIKKFRDLISDEIVFFINDGSNQHIEGKGSGLQRLAYILLHHRIIEKTKSKSVIFLIDEPDVYLHQGLQNKLLKHLKKLTKNAQIFITTHSPVFIDSYTLDNVFLLELEITQRHYKRKNKEFNVLDTKVVEIDKLDGTRKIRDYLGIEDLDYELLDSYNIIVEGNTDKIYIENLCLFFGLSIPKIINANGADNILKYLEFYQSFYQDRENKPCLLVLLDNDNKGRDVYQKLKLDKYEKLLIYKEFVPNCMGENNDVSKIQKVNCDWQIEDFVYPKILCELVNDILKKRNEKQNTEFKYINSKTIETKIKQAAFKQRGILALIEHEKNEKNPETGQIINFFSNQHPSEQIKYSLAILFQESLQGNKKIINLIQEEDLKYPKVKEFLIRITEPHNFIQV